MGYALLFICRKSLCHFLLLFLDSLSLSKPRTRLKKGKSFNARFAWRLVLLFCFAMFNSMFYQGDILGTYAVIGFVLIPASYLNNKTVFWLAILLLLQPYEWGSMVSGLARPRHEIDRSTILGIFRKDGTLYHRGFFYKYGGGQYHQWQKSRSLWTWESGRTLQTAALFMLGMLAGRKSLFKISPESNRFWRMTLVYAAIAFIPLFYGSTYPQIFTESETMIRPLQLIISSWWIWPLCLFWFRDSFCFFKKHLFMGH